MRGEVIRLPCQISQSVRPHGLGTLGRARWRGEDAARGARGPDWREFAGTSSRASISSHSHAFGVTAYRAAWLKRYYPLEFFVTLVNNQPMGFYPVETLKQDGWRFGVAFLNPCVNRSGVECIPEEDSVLLGLRFVKDVGTALAKTIVEEREGHGPYAGAADLVRRTGLKPRAAESLVMAGAFDYLAPAAAEDQHGRGPRRQVGKVRSTVRSGGGVRGHPGQHGTAEVTVRWRQFRRARSQRCKKSAIRKKATAPMDSTVQGEWTSRLPIRANPAAADISATVTTNVEPTSPAKAKTSLAMIWACSPRSKRRALIRPLSLLSSATRCRVTSIANDNRNSPPKVICDNSGDAVVTLQNKDQSN